MVSEKDIGAYRMNAEAIREMPHGPEAQARRRWIANWHIRHGGMPPLDLRPDAERREADWFADRSRVEREIAGALKSAIVAHGPIDFGNHSSAAKRIYSALKVNRASGAKVRCGKCCEHVGARKDGRPKAHACPGRPLPKLRGVVQ